ncbi:type III secretion system needle filament subunit SctF [Pantoea sp. Mb-10]|uniref:type III secretion system needle filament subunit SctF n=1 Tax=unclassified Pantoea TaxID=2630326 RepID=UPI001E4D65D5|nr:MULTISPECIES: type III secretion system needle filament subunit SctF [unclassified Pantoea]MCE0489052.1 type III secretion system needle filament subunit SctF [Pantoea sp. Mb-10]MCE0503592.1 type III secretion system needle filament subunit SctF [Pantoea sp. Pb-8]
MSIKNSVGRAGNPGYEWQGFLTVQSETFDNHVSKLNSDIQKALEELQKDPSKPENLSKYQALVSEYTLYRNAQSNITKTYKDISSAIISNFR